MKEPGQRPFAGLDLRRPKGYTAASTAPAEVHVEVQGDPCPRCESRDTKFCYYNNYNTSQPRHYCKSCRRYWTKGGSLRNVPVGGGSRKSASSSSSSASPKRAKNSKRRRVALAAPPEPEPGTTDAAGAVENEDIAGTGTGTIRCPTTDVDAAGATPNRTVGVGDPATTVDAARVEATANDTVDAARTEATSSGTVDGLDTAVDAARTEATTNSNVQDPDAAVDAARKEATAGGAMDDPGAHAAVDDGCFADHPSVALGLGVADAGGKEAPDLSPFEWPLGCDLGSYWSPGVFADTDPLLFLNLP